MADFDRRVVAIRPKVPVPSVQVICREHPRETMDSFFNDVFDSVFHSDGGECSELDVRNRGPFTVQPIAVSTVIQLLLEKDIKIEHVAHLFPPSYMISKSSSMSSPSSSTRRIGQPSRVSVSCATAASLSNSLKTSERRVRMLL